MRRDKGRQRGISIESDISRERIHRESNIKRFIFAFFFFYIHPHKYLGAFLQIDTSASVYDCAGIINRAPSAEINCTLSHTSWLFRYPARCFDTTERSLDRRITGPGGGAWTLPTCNVYSLHVELIYTSLQLAPPTPLYFHPLALPRPTPNGKSVVITSETRRSYQLDESIAAGCPTATRTAYDYALVMQARSPHWCSTYINLPAL